MLLANRDWQSNSKKTRHIEIRYYFITDNIKRKQVRVEYCPTADMARDFFTKPFQGSLFQTLHSQILNLDHGDRAVTERQEGVGPRADGRSCSDVGRARPHPESNIHRSLSYLK